MSVETVLGALLVTGPLAVVGVSFAAARRLAGNGAWLAAGAAALVVAGAAFATGARYRSEAEAVVSSCESCDDAQRGRILREADKDVGVKVYGSVLAALAAAPIGVAVGRRLKGSAANADKERREMSEKLRVALAALFAGIAGLLVSQYAPVFGGFATIGDPWSRARESLIGEHVLAFVAAAVVVVVGWPRLRRGTGDDDRGA